MKKKNTLILAVSALCLLGSCGPDTPSTSQPTEPADVAVESVSLNKTEVSMAIGEEITLKATINPDNATKKEVTWISSNPEVVTVENGLVTAVAGGVATITAKADGKEATCTVKVGTLQITGEESMYIGRKQTLTAEVANVGGEVAWSVLEEKDGDDNVIAPVVTIDENGVVQAIDIGTSKVVATSKVNPEITAQIQITVSLKDPKIEEINIETNYTLNMIDLSSESGGVATVSVTEKGVYLDEETIIWFDDNKTYFLEIDPETNMEAEELSYIFFAEDYLCYQDDGTAITPEDFLLTWNVSMMLGMTNWVWYDYDEEADEDLWISMPLSPDYPDFSLFLFENIWNLNGLENLHTMMSVGADGLSFLSLTGLTATNELNMMILYDYDKVGTTDLTLNVTRLAFHEGGEAEDGDGSGEDF